MTSRRSFLRRLVTSFVAGPILAAELLRPRVPVVEDEFATNSTYDANSIRFVTHYNVTTDQAPTRFDCYIVDVP